MWLYMKQGCLTPADKLSPLRRIYRKVYYIQYKNGKHTNGYEC